MDGVSLLVLKLLNPQPNLVRQKHAPPPPPPPPAPASTFLLPLLPSHSVHHCSTLIQSDNVIVNVAGMPTAAPTAATKASPMVSPKPSASRNARMTNSTATTLVNQPPPALPQADYPLLHVPPPLPPRFHLAPLLPLTHAPPSMTAKKVLIPAPSASSLAANIVPSTAAKQPPNASQDPASITTRISFRTAAPTNAHNLPPPPAPALHIPTARNGSSPIAPAASRQVSCASWGLRENRPVPMKPSHMEETARVPSMRTENSSLNRSVSAAAPHDNGLLNPLLQSHVTPLPTALSPIQHVPHV